MDKNLSNEQFYIVSLDNGIRREEPVTIEVFNSFKDGSKLVQLNHTVFGLLNTNSLNPETMYIDDYAVIKADIAELFDVDHEETKRIVTEDKVIGTFTTLNYSKNIETRISGTAILNNVIKAINEGNINNEKSVWIDRVLQSPSGINGNRIKDTNQVADIIDLGLYTLIKIIELQSGVKIDKPYENAIRKNYLRMILFDLIIGKKYRGFDYFLISKMTDEGKPMWTDAYFAPISIVNNSDKEKVVADNEYVINNKIIDRDTILLVLFSKYHNEIKKLTEAINDAKKLYSDAISRIIYNNTDIQKAASLETMILKNLEKISKMEKDYESKLDKDKKTNKVERTMATQSLNVRVTTKLDLIQKKYPINPKDHKDIIDSNKKAPKKDDIKLIVEDDKNSKGFIGTAVLISLMTFICGIAIGVVYVITRFGS